MSKRDLKNCLSELNKEQLEEQVINLYDKFPTVKTFFDFVFKPNERQLLQDFKLKVSNEYFPVKIKKAKARRSVAQKMIKHFISLGVDPFVTVDAMLYSIEIAQTYSSEKEIKQELFFKSMLNSFQQAVSFMIEKGVLYDFKNRVEAIRAEAENQDWFNVFEFNSIVEKFDY
jgi:hypothetical protein